MFCVTPNLRHSSKEGSPEDRQEQGRCQHRFEGGLSESLMYFLPGGKEQKQEGGSDDESKKPGKMPSAGWDLDTHLFHNHCFVAKPKRCPTCKERTFSNCCTCPGWACEACNHEVTIPLFRVCFGDCLTLMLFRSVHAASWLVPTAPTALMLATLADCLSPVPRKKKSSSSA